jgi:hypothetical protein
MVTHHLVLDAVQHSLPLADERTNEFKGKPRRTWSAYLLKQQFCSVRNSQLSHFFRALAVCTPSVVAHKAACLTCIDLEFIRWDHKTFQEELGSTVADQTVAFHFAQPQTTFARPTFSGLSSQSRTWTSGSHSDVSVTYLVKPKNKSPCSGVHFVHHHVFYSNNQATIIVDICGMLTQFL